MTPADPRLGPILVIFQGGNEAEGLVALDRFLAHHPDHAEALALAGFCRLRRGEAGEALGFLDRAVVADPGSWLARMNRAGARRALADYAGAAEDYLAAARGNPQAEFWIEAAAMYAALARRDEARRALEEALHLVAEHPVALNNLGLILEESDPREARALFLRAAEADPGNAEIAGNLERMLVEEGLHIGKGQGASAARPFWEQALRRWPDMAGLWTGLGNHLLELGEIVGAEEAFARAVALKPERAEARINLGIVLHRQDRPEAALLLYAEAAALEEGPSSSSALRWNRALSLLALGRLEEGFADYETRDYLDAYRRLPFPRWDGRPFPGKTLLLHAEQGYGDAIQFARYAALAKERGGPGAQVLLACDPPLERLLARVRGVAGIVPASALAAARCDWEAPLLSLPHLFNTRLETIPAAVPYIDLEGERTERRPGEPSRIGLVARGNPKYGNDRRRSIPSEALAALPRAAPAGVRWVGFHHGGNRPRGTEGWLEEGLTGVADFYDTALRLREMDLVIAVDTATAHLAGALGVPVWVLLPFAPDWRWLRGRSDSPWYPTARLFRQPRDGAWEEVVAEVAQVLADRFRE